MIDYSYLKFLLGLATKHSHKWWRKTNKNVYHEYQIRQSWHDQSVSEGVRGVHPPLSQWCILYIPLYLHKTYKFPQFSFNLLFYLGFLLPLFWSWCIYASCFIRTGRPWGELQDIHSICWSD